MINCFPLKKKRKENVSLISYNEWGLVYLKNSTWIEIFEKPIRGNKKLLSHM